MATWSELQDRQPAYALIAGVDLVVIRYDDELSVFCLHRGALLADGHVAGQSLICGVHNWDYRLDSGVSEYNNAEVALSNSAIQAIGCLGMRACHTNNCPVGIATQQPRLRERLIVEASTTRLKNYLQASIELMKLLARACGHARLADFSTNDLTIWKREIASLTGVSYAGVVPLHGV